MDHNITQALKSIMSGVSTLASINNNEQTITNNFIPATFQIMQNNDRPHEYLQAILDLVRCNFEPNPLGTFFLNSNAQFIYDAITEDKTNLGYASIVSEPNQSVGSFWQDTLTKHLHAVGYDSKCTEDALVVISTGDNRYNLELVKEIHAHIEVGLEITDAINVLANEISDNTQAMAQNVHCGFCMDESLDTKLRVSILFPFQFKISIIMMVNRMIVNLKDSNNYIWH